MDSEVFEWVATIAPEHKIGEVIYIKTAPEDPGIITGMLFREVGVTYEIKRDDHISYHYPIELTKDKPVE